MLERLLTREEELEEGVMVVVEELLIVAVEVVPDSCCPLTTALVVEDPSADVTLFEVVEGASVKPVIDPGGVLDPSE